MDEVIKHYSTDDVTVVWRPEKCEHSAHCFRSLPDVFNPRVRPWVQPENASSEELVRVVRGCPSGALTIQGDEKGQEGTGGDEKGQEAAELNSDLLTIEIEKNGPLKVQGQCILKYPDGKQEVGDWVYLCRCGASKCKPLCDDSHEDVPPFDPKGKTLGHF